MNITEYYIELLEHFRSVTLAEQEFRRQMDDDSSLRSAYYKWCEDNELSPRRALREFGQTYIEERELRWESLTDFDENE